MHVANRIDQGAPSGNFDLKHLCSIHHHLFQDVYEWAGRLRQVNFGKGESGFHPYGRLEMGMADVHKRLSDQGFLRGMKAEKFAPEAAEYIGDVNRLHPFREGNGRTQLQYLKQLGQRAGHDIDLTKFDRVSWVQASIEANKFDTARMADCISAALSPWSRTSPLELGAGKRSGMISVGVRIAGCARFSGEPKQACKKTAISAIIDETAIF